MRFIELAKLSLSTFKSHKMRSFLTTLGILIGVMTVIAILSLIQGLNKTVEGQISSLGSNTIFIQKYSWQLGARMDWRKLVKRKDLTIKDAEALKRLESVDKVACSKSRQVSRIEYKNNEVLNTEIVGATPEIEYTDNYSVSIGRFITDDDENHRRKVCVIGTHLVDNLFPNENPIGKRLTIRRRKFIIIGILEHKGTFLGRSQDNLVIIPLSTFDRTFPEPHGPMRVFGSLSIHITPKSAKRIENTIEEIREVLRLRRGLSYDKPDDFGINTQETLRQMYKQITSVAFIVMIGVAGISLLVGGIGIMNIMLVSVAERTREIGLRKAVGASNRDVLYQFLFESAALSCIGGGIGIAVGIGIAKVVNLVFHFPSAAPLWVIILGFGFSAAVGISFGLYPARKAAKLNPIEALRYE